MAVGLFKEKTEMDRVVENGAHLGGWLGGVKADGHRVDSRDISNGYVLGGSNWNCEYISSACV